MRVTRAPPAVRHARRVHHILSAATGKVIERPRRRPRHDNRETKRRIQEQQLQRHCGVISAWRVREDRMVPKENTYLLASPTCEIMRINIPEKYYMRELTKEDLEYYTADPLWIKVRLFLFWSFWTAFLVVLILSIFIYCCVFPSMC